MATGKLQAYQNRVSLGLGLLQLGRPWGVRPHRALPAVDQINQLIQTAIDVGISFFDTAPAYGASEERFGAAIQSLNLGNQLSVATKFGEYWAGDGTTIDHSLRASVQSLTHSIGFLGSVDLLQIHKCSAETVRSTDVRSFCALVRAVGIPVGASIGELDALDAVLSSEICDTIQFPLHEKYSVFSSVVAQIESAGVLPIINRPFAMGAAGASDLERCRAFEFIAKHINSGVVLTGTVNPIHLRENAISFRKVFGSDKA